MKTNLEVFDPRKLEVKQAIEKYKDLKIDGIEDKEGYEKVHRAQMNLRDIRLDIDKVYKLYISGLNQKKDDASIFKEELIGEFSGLEISLKAQKDKIKEEKDRIKEEKLQKEREKLQKRVNILGEYNYLMNLNILGQMSDGLFEDLVKVKKQDFEVQEEKRIKQEKETQKIKEERKKLDKEKKEFEDKKKAEAKKNEIKEINILPEKELEIPVKKLTKKVVTKIYKSKWNIFLEKHFNNSIICDKDGNDITKEIEKFINN